MYGGSVHGSMGRVGIISDGGEHVQVDE
jgi:hypothetical protein